MNYPIKCTVNTKILTQEILGVTKAAVEATVTK